MVPPGWILINKNCNEGAGGSKIFILYKMGNPIIESYVSEIKVKSGSSVGVSSGYKLVGGTKGNNLNYPTSNK